MDSTFNIFDSDFLSDKTQFLTFFVMAYSSARLLSYILIGLASKFNFYSYHRFLGLAVYFTFIGVFIFCEFVVFRNKE